MLKQATTQLKEDQGNCQTDLILTLSQTYLCLTKRTYYGRRNHIKGRLISISCKMVMSSQQNTRLSFWLRSLKRMYKQQCSLLIVHALMVMELVSSSLLGIQLGRTLQKMFRNFFRMGNRLDNLTPLMLLSLLKLIVQSWQVNTCQYLVAMWCINAFPK